MPINSPKVVHAIIPNMDCSWSRDAIQHAMNIGTAIKVATITPLSPKPLNAANGRATKVVPSSSLLIENRILGIDLSTSTNDCHNPVAEFDVDVSNDAIGVLGSWLGYVTGSGSGRPD